MKRKLLFVIVATFLLSPLDYFQVLAGVRTLGAAYWATPIKFALLGLLLGWISWDLDPKPHSNRITAVIFHGIVFTLGYISTLFIHNQKFILLAIFCSMIIQYVISKWKFKIDMAEIAPFVWTLAAAGPVLETLDVILGDFNYIGHRLVPYWLPALWASGAFFVRALVGITKDESIDHNKSLEKFLNAIAPIARAWFTITYIVSNVKELGFRGATISGLQLYGWIRR